MAMHPPCDLELLHGRTGLRQRRHLHCRYALPAGKVDRGLNMGPAQNAPRTLLSPPGVDMNAVAWGLAACLFAVLYSASEWPALVGVMMVSQAFCGRLVWYRFRETQQAVLPDFLCLLLFSKLFTKTLTILAVLSNENAESMESVGAASSTVMMEISQVPLEYQFQ